MAGVALHAILSAAKRGALRHYPLREDGLRKPLLQKGIGTNMINLLLF